MTLLPADEDREKDAGDYDSEEDTLGDPIGICEPKESSYFGGAFFDSHPSEQSESSDKFMTRYLNFSRRMNRYAKVDDVGVRIALLDTGIDATHPFMRTWELRRESFPDRGYKDFTSRDDSKTYAKARDGHGTHCAGLILQFAPLASLYVARLAKSRASCQVDRTFNTKVAKALKHAIHEWKADIISMSFGLRQEDPAINSLLTEATLRDVIVFAAAGNASTFFAYPARHRLVISINASEENSEYWNRAEFAPFPRRNANNFSILGKSVLSTWPKFRNDTSIVTPKGREGTWKYRSGTSMATALAVSLGANIIGYSRHFATKLPRVDPFDLIVKVFKVMSTPHTEYDILVPFSGQHGRFRHCHEEGDFRAVIISILREKEF